MTQHVLAQCAEVEVEIEKEGGEGVRIVEGEGEGVMIVEEGEGEAGERVMVVEEVSPCVRKTRRDRLAEVQRMRILEFCANFRRRALSSQNWFREIRAIQPC